MDWMMFLMAALGVATHWLKQLVMMRREAPAGFGHVSLRTYWLTHWPETLMALTTAAAALAVLLEFDQLSLATAWGAGYLGNSAADLIGGRVQAIIGAGKGGSGNAGGTG